VSRGNVECLLCLVYHGVITCLVGTQAGAKMCKQGTRLCGGYSNEHEGALGKMCKEIE
jgi:hypothetical protein